MAVCMQPFVCQRRVGPSPMSSIEDRKPSRSEREQSSLNTVPHQPEQPPTTSMVSSLETISDGIRSLSITTSLTVKTDPSTKDGSQEGSIDLTDGAADPRKVFVGGIAWNTTNESFTTLFSQFGKILKSKIIRNTDSGAARGYGFVKFHEPSSAARAVAASERLTLDGRRIDCKFALPTVAGGQHVRKLFVGGLPRESNAHTLKKHFRQYGKVINAVVMVERSTARSRGFGFVTMGSTEATQIILSTPQVIKGRRIDVHKAKSREQMEKERVIQMESEVVTQQQGYWQAANNHFCGGPASSAGVASPNGAEMGMPMYMYHHPANMSPVVAPQSPTPLGLPPLTRPRGKMSPGSSSVSPGLGVFYPPPWAHLPFPPLPNYSAGGGPPQLHMHMPPVAALPYISG
eukprot:g36336.t1